MSHTVYFGKVSKRKNSTLQPSLTTSFDVLFKTPTSLDRPTFTLSADSFDYNYAKMDDRYYFVTDIVSRNNDLWEVTCELDPLATFKSEILASTQFVSYSSVKSSDWLMDSRIPILSQGVAHKTRIINPVLSRSGNYVLSVNGANGCSLYKVSLSDLQSLISEVSTWKNDLLNDFLDNLTSPGGDIVVATENMYKVIARAGAVGNAYSDAPSNIRSCIWVPFSDSAFNVTQAGKSIYLGQFDTTVTADEIASTPYTDSFTFSIPWTYSDWRRAKCEDLYLYLPMVGLTSIDSENITSNDSMTIRYSLTPTDGAIAYEIECGNQIIGSYGASCSANYPIGISQQSSAGELINSVLSGAEKAVNMAINSSISPVSTGAAIAGTGLNVLQTSYDFANTQYTRHNTTIGGIGGGVGAGLDLYATLFDVVHAPLIEPSQMVATMGYPTMKPLTLSSCSGYCQCANAHVSAAAESEYLNMIDAYLNSGFYIE